jgi:predicted XRE-type DNA-binding protein
MHEEEDMPKNKSPRNDEGHMSQEEVAEILGMSRSRVSEVEKKALRKFKYFLLKKYKREDI